MVLNQFFAIFIAQRPIDIVVEFSNNRNSNKIENDVNRILRSDNDVDVTNFCCSCHEEVKVRYEESKFGSVKLVGMVDCIFHSLESSVNFFQ